jgi:hypothetical protein
MTSRIPDSVVCYIHEHNLYRNLELTNGADKGKSNKEAVASSSKG